MNLKNARYIEITGDTVREAILHPKSAYSADGDGDRGLKDMVKACHRSGIEVVLEMPFCTAADKMMMLECLRYYVMEYHIDGFILNPFVVSMESVHADPFLKTPRLWNTSWDSRQSCEDF